MVTTRSINGFLAESSVLIAMSEIGVSHYLDAIPERSADIANASLDT